METRFGERWRDVLRFNRVDRRHVYPGVTLKVPRRLEDVEDFTPMPAEYPGGDNEAKLILVDLEAQFLGAYEYGKRVFSAPVASGEVDNETPDGEFRITAYHSAHRSTEYFIEDTGIPYPIFEWAIVPLADDGKFHLLKGGAVVRIVGGTREKKHRETLK